MMSTMTGQICLQSLRLASVTEALSQMDQTGGCRKIIKRKSEVEDVGYTVRCG